MTAGLHKYDLNVIVFNDPEQALSQYKAKHYDMILLDVRMADSNCFELAKKIWSIDPDARIGFFSTSDIYENEVKKVFKDLKIQPVNFSDDESKFCLPTGGLVILNFDDNVTG